MVAWGPPSRRCAIPCRAGETAWSNAIGGGRVNWVHCGASMDAAPAYSPDGKRIAFVRATETSSVLAIRDLATGGVTTLDSTRSSSSDVWLDEPSWSPDGRQIVYDKVHRDAAQDKVTDTRILIVNADVH